MANVCSPSVTPNHPLRGPILSGSYPSTHSPHTSTHSPHTSYPTRPGFPAKRCVHCMREWLDIQASMMEPPTALWIRPIGGGFAPRASLNSMPKYKHLRQVVCGGGAESIAFDGKIEKRIVHTQIASFIYSGYMLETHVAEKIWKGVESSLLRRFAFPAGTCIAALMLNQRLLTGSSSNDPSDVTQRFWLDINDSFTFIAP